MDLRAEASELLGTFLMVAVGLASIAAGAGLVGSALAFGFAVTALIYALAPVGGAHFNPAITLAFATTGHFPWRRVPSYLLAQCAGALAAAYAVRALVGHAVGATHLPPGTASWQAFVGEAILTALLALVIVSCATHKGRHPSAAGLAIGLAVAAGALTSGAFSGASMNPARSLGPALAGADYGILAIDIAGPITGACLAMLAFEWMRHGRAPKRDTLGVTGPVELEA